MIFCFKRLCKSVGKSCVTVDFPITIEFSCFFLIYNAAIGFIGYSLSTFGAIYDILSKK